MWRAKSFIAERMELLAMKNTPGLQKLRIWNRTSVCAIGTLGKFSHSSNSNHTGQKVSGSYNLFKFSLGTLKK